ncbi:MAG: hypothetical protein OXE79_04375 [Acidimicrobiaceae bacterium]|nr:hypothetical protein [Acidimicrobiaceae bacterium]
MIIECKGVVDDKALAAEAWTRDHWIPAVEGTAQLPDELRCWAYEVITEARHLPKRLGDLAKQPPTTGGGRADEPALYAVRSNPGRRR